VPVQHPIKPRNLGIDFFVADLPFFDFFADGRRDRKDPSVRGDLSELSHWPIVPRPIFPSHSHMTVRQNLLDLPPISAGFWRFIEITNNIPAFQTEHRNLPDAALLNRLRTTVRR
jgi:hypothetical protein